MLTMARAPCSRHIALKFFGFLKKLGGIGEEKIVRIGVEAMTAAERMRRMRARRREGS